MQGHSVYMGGPQLDVEEYTNGEQERLEPVFIGESFGNQVLSNKHIIINLLNGRREKHKEP